MSRQYGKLHLITGADTFRLHEERNAISEGQIQEFIFAHPELLPIDEIEPVFQPLTPICRELTTPAGPADILFINDRGLITLVECKLWKNPEARREVIAQILDYAKEICGWTYERLQSEVHRSIGNRSRSLFDMVSASSEELEESEFVDAVSANLRRGRFLLLIVGDGIRQDVERIGDFLHQHAYLNFSLALVETKVFRVPPACGGGYIFQPRVLAQTVEIERAVFRIEDERIVAQPIITDEASGQPARRTKISEQVFYEQLDGNTRLSSELRTLIGDANALGLDLEPGESSLKLKYHVEDHAFNFVVFYTNNTFRNFGIASAADDIGHPEIGEEYLTRLAALFEGAKVRTKKDSRFHWTVRSRNDGYLTIPELLSVKEQWLQIVSDTVSQIDAAIHQEESETASR